MMNLQFCEEGTTGIESYPYWNLNEINKTALKDAILN